MMKIGNFTPGGRAEEALERIISLTGEGDGTTLYLHAGRTILRILRQISEQLNAPTGVRGFSRDLALRAIASKSAENWAAIITLLDAGHAQCALALLRPLSEEMIYARYLTLIPEKDVSLYICYRAQIEIYSKLIAQQEFFPAIAKEYKKPTGTDLPQSDIELIDVTRRHIARLAKCLSEIARNDGWPKGPNKTIRDMAVACGLEPYYNFVYRASSSAVHASLQELGRMAWGDAEAGNYKISPTTFAPYYKDFVLIYGGWMAGLTAVTMVSIFPNLLDKEDDDLLSVLLALYVEPTLHNREPKLVTPEELGWLDSSRVP